MAHRLPGRHTTTPAERGIRPNTTERCVGMLGVNEPGCDYPRAPASRVRPATLETSLRLSTRAPLFPPG